MKAFKTLRGARNHAAAGGPVIKIGDLYIAADAPELWHIALTGIDLIGPEGHITGTVTLRHLERLGNANWAEPGPTKAFSGPKIFDALSKEGASK